MFDTYLTGYYYDDDSYYDYYYGDDSWDDWYDYDSVGSWDDYWFSWYKRNNGNQDQKCEFCCCFYFWMEVFRLISQKSMVLIYA